MKKSFTKEVLSRFHKMSKSYWELIIVLTIFTTITDFIFEWLIYRYSESISVGILMIFLASIWSLILTIGFVRMIFNEKRHVSIRELLMSTREDFGRITISMLLIMTALSLSFIIPIVGLYLAFRIQFCFYYQIDRREYFMSSVKESIQLTRGNLVKQIGIWSMVILTYFLLLFLIIKLPENLIKFDLAYADLIHGKLNSGVVYFFLNTGINLTIYLTILLHLVMYLQLQEVNVASNSNLEITKPSLKEKQAT